MHGMWMCVCVCVWWLWAYICMSAIQPRMPERAAHGYIIYTHAQANMCVFMSALEETSRAVCSCVCAYKACTSAALTAFRECARSRSFALRQHDSTVRAQCCECARSLRCHCVRAERVSAVGARARPQYIFDRRSFRRLAPPRFRSYTASCISVSRCSREISVCGSCFFVN